MTASIYTPDATGSCTVCQRPEAEHARSGGWAGDEARCMPGPTPVIAEIVQPQTMPEAEWRALGERLFGADPAAWRFVCPHCKSVASVTLARKLPEDSKAKLRKGWGPESECVGRYISGTGCDWAAYGLFCGPFFVQREGGSKTPVFGFDLTKELP